jgi:hypothetical protein
MNIEVYGFILAICLIVAKIVQVVFKLDMNTLLGIFVLLLLLTVSVNQFNKKKESFIYSIDDLENNKWGQLDGGKSVLNSDPEYCQGWNNLKYDNTNNKFVRDNCPETKDDDAFMNIGAGDGSCYKSSNNNTRPLYNKYDKIGINYPASSITAKYQGPDITDNAPSVNCDLNDQRKSLFPFSYNKCSPSCCPSPYSCSGGCVCLSSKQKQCFKDGWGQIDNIENMPTKTQQFLPGVPTPTSTQ